VALEGQRGRIIASKAAVCQLTKSANPSRAPRRASHSRVRKLSAQRVSTSGAWRTMGWPPCSSNSTSLRAASCVFTTEIRLRLPLLDVPCSASSSTWSTRPAGSGSGL
jgi:hypothetical protein